MVRRHDAAPWEKGVVSSRSLLSAQGWIETPRAACEHWGASASLEDPQRHGQLLPALPDTR